MNNSNLFRKRIKAEFPYVKVSIRRVSFQDLARADRLCLTVSGDRRGELWEINRIAESFNIVPDGNLRWFPPANLDASEYTPEPIPVAK